MAYSQSNTFNGHGDDVDAWMKNPGDDSANTLPLSNPSYPSSTISQMTGTNCSSPISGTMAKFPDHDLFGNYTNLDGTVLPAVNGARPPLGPTGERLYVLGDLYNNQCGRTQYNAFATSNSCQIGLASWQATAPSGLEDLESDHLGQDYDHHLIPPGGEPPDMTLLS
jgi:hypothetical protein